MTYGTRTLMNTKQSFKIGITDMEESLKFVVLRKEQNAGQLTWDESTCVCARVCCVHVYKCKEKD